ncbi:TadE family type IV pilus minor pilin [Nesterenkonia lutea]|uniref:TadE-like domain-containing protein n=1 Tax=Nesterenkonia lutea TaxID=272919 RepID=A0ABR9JI31_9MICC|nr:TadE family type IV pilus minor pilin [Nesterenkonia lutea]MBE1525450.1 hypothetical protein [Nesterenkonia lutea]
MRCPSEPLCTRRDVAAHPSSAAERGSISAEFALALPGVILVLLLVLSFAMQGAAQVSLEEGARVAARELARGESAVSAEAAARRVSGERTAFRLDREDPYVTVVLSRPVRVLGWLELDATQDARATARVEVSP